MLWYNDYRNDSIQEGMSICCVLCILTSQDVILDRPSKNGVSFNYDLGDKLYGATVSHNHPTDVTEYSFSKEDFDLFEMYNLEILRGCDEKYTYELTRNSADIDDMPVKWQDEESYFHMASVIRAREKGFGYRRWNR